MLVRSMPRYVGMERQKRIVYIVRSDNFPSRHYTGITSDVRARLQWHNRSTRGYGVRYRPWSLVVSIEFPEEAAARRFERYLKSGSGRAFAKRHFAPDAGVHKNRPASR